jgi:hypothetical protein
MDGSMRRTQRTRRAPAFLLALLASLAAGCISWDDVHAEAVDAAIQATGPPAGVDDMAAYRQGIEMIVSDILAKVQNGGYPAPPTEDEIIDLHLTYQDKSSGEDWTLERVDPMQERANLDPFAIPALPPPAPGQ